MTVSGKIKKTWQIFIFTITVFAWLIINCGVYAASPQAFSDVPASHWAYAQIMEMSQANIVTGYSDGIFRPNASVSYGAFSLMLARAFYSSDLAAYMTTHGIASANTEVGRAIIEAHGILIGTRLQSDEAHISSMLTRDDMEALMYNILIDYKAPLPANDELSASQAAIKDFSSIAPARHLAVTTCYARGLLTGRSDGTFGPLAEMNRAQAAVVFSRLLHYIQENGGSPDSMEVSEQPSDPGLPEFAMLSGENTQQMMNRINAATPPYAVGKLTNGKPITTENIQEMMELFKEGFPDGTPWDDSDFYRYNSRSFGSVHACSAFAAALSDSIFGEDAPIRKHQDFDALKVGDVIWMKNTANGYWHSFVVTSTDREADRYGSCSGNTGGMVNWNGFGKFSTFDESTVGPYTYVFSRY